MPDSLLEALRRMAKAGGYENPALLLARRHVPKDRRRWWVTCESEYGARNPTSEQTV